MTDVDDFIAAVPSEARRADARTLLDLMKRVTGLEPYLWGTSIIGFGSYHYRYASGREGDAPLAGFSPRKAATTIYLADGVDEYAASMALLGPHTTGVGCLYLKSFAAIDLSVLEKIVRESFAVASSEGFAQASGTAKK